LLSAFLDRDYPVLSAFVLVVAVLVLASRIATDLLYAVFDPRIRHQ
jgi:ABC-type dipeptide/oligopeptide/nickel transport system permease component